MKEPTNGEIAIMIENIIHRIDNGFEEIHRRLDILNGQTYKNTKFRWGVTAIMSAAIIIGLGNIIKMLIS